MRALVNGVATELPDRSTVADVVAATCRSPKGVAVAVDREVVPRSRWDRLVEEGASVEVVEAAAGG